MITLCLDHWEVWKERKPGEERDTCIEQFVGHELVMQTSNISTATALVLAMDSSKTSSFDNFSSLFFGFMCSTLKWICPRACDFECHATHKSCIFLCTNEQNKHRQFWNQKMFLEVHTKAFAAFRKCSIRDFSLQQFPLLWCAVLCLICAENCIMISSGIGFRLVQSHFQPRRESQKNECTATPHTNNPFQTFETKQISLWFSHSSLSRTRRRVTPAFPQVWWFVSLIGFRVGGSRRCRSNQSSSTSRFGAR